jgi:hypothetical protein
MAASILTTVLVSATMSHWSLLKALVPSSLQVYCYHFFCLGGGWLLHDALSPIFRSWTEDPTVSLMISSFRVCLWVSLSVLLLPRLSCYFVSRSLVLLLNALPDPLCVWTLCSAGKAWWINCSMAVEKSCKGSPWSWVHVFR